MLLPVINIDLGNTTDEKLEFTLIEDVDEVCWDKLVETCDERIELLFNPLDDLPFRDKSESDISFCNILIGGL